MRRFPLLLLLLTLALTAGTAHALQRVVEGSATLKMQEYSAESERVSEKATSFSQQYTVMLSQRDTFFNGRGGAYTLMTGYEINLLDPTLERNGVRDTTVASISTRKFYYNGDLVLAPGGLPFRLSLFARDTKKSTFLDNAQHVSFNTGLQADTVGNTSFGHLITPDIDTDISNGTQKTVGGTLLIGIRNGSYLGEYRDLLSQLPRILIDYKQATTKDLHSTFSKTHMRTRDLAFVSLNKKDNWVHFRMKDHSDYLRPQNNTMTKQVLIGTIDQHMTRQWINLTNWIKLSGELSYLIDDRVEEDPKQTYQMNMMVLSRREEIASSIISQFSRENDGRFVTYKSEIPMILSIDHNRDTALRSRVVYEAQERSFLEGQMLSVDDPWAGVDAGASDFRDLYLDNQLELQRSQPVVLKTRLELESRSNSGRKEGLAVRLGGEILSNNRLKQSLNWLGGYALTTTSTTLDTPEGGGVFVQNDLYGRVDKDLSRNLRVGGRTSLSLGSGEGRQSLGFRIPTMEDGLRGGSGSGERVDNDYSGMLTRGDLNLYLDHRYQRLANRLDLNFEYFTAADVTAQQSSLRHTLSFNEIKHRLDWSSGVVIGDNSGSSRSVGFDFVGEAPLSTSSQNMSWDSRVNYHYDPNRSAALTLLGVIGGTQGDAGRSAYKVGEEFTYRIFTANGIIRRLAEISEEIGYERVSAAVDDRNSSIYARLKAIYFPTKYLHLKIRSEIVDHLSGGSLQQINAGEVGFNFQKFKVLASYSQARKEWESEIFSEINERRWEVEVRKIF